MVRALVQELEEISQTILEIHKKIKSDQTDNTNYMNLCIKEYNLCMEASAIMDEIMRFFIKIKRFEKNSEKTKIFVRNIKKQVDKIVGGL
jgi:hypothetical protein